MGIQALCYDNGTIGEGSYGKVYRATLPPGSKWPGSKYAVKVVDIIAEEGCNIKDTPSFRSMEQEICALRECVRCPQIVEVLGVNVCSGRLMVVMELCEHGSISDILRRIPGDLAETDIRIIIREVLMALKYLHDRKRIHRDVKAGNILVTKRFCIKLADLGISYQLQTAETCNTQIGSPYWMAPEVIKGIPYCTKADRCAFGIS